MPRITRDRSEAEPTAPAPMTPTFMFATSSGGARREPARRRHDGLEDSFRWLSSDDRGPADVEIRNALDAAVQRNAFLRADAFHAVLGAEECRDRVSVEADPGGN